MQKYFDRSIAIINIIKEAEIKLNHQQIKNKIKLNSIQYNIERVQRFIAQKEKLLNETSFGEARR